MKEEIVNQMMKIGFTKMESMIYIVVLEEGDVTGYQIAKILNVSRASVYPVIEVLLKKRVLVLMPGETNRYSAEQPEIVLANRVEDYNSAAKYLQEKLPDIRKKCKEDKYFNLSGFESVVAKCKEIFMQSVKEVYINTDFELSLFEKEFKYLKEKGVRVILFTFANIVSEEIPVEFYYYEIPNATCRNKRIMVASDMKRAVIAGEEANNSFVGTFTENRLFAKIIAEHVHHDIYLLRLKEKYGKNLIEDDILIKSLLENRKELCKFIEEDK